MQRVLVWGNASRAVRTEGFESGWLFPQASLSRAYGSRSDSELNPSKSKNSGRWGWLLLLPAGFAGFLGVWQVNRYQWKVDLLEKREAGLKAEPQELAATSLATADYTRTAGTGVFNHDKSIYIGPRPRTVMGTANAGYTLITPFTSKDSRSALVNRGWVPAEWKEDPKVRALNSPTNEVEIEGIVRSSESPSSFVPDNDPAKGLWFWVDVPGIAASCNLPTDTPLVEVYDKSRDAEERQNMPTTMDVLAFKAQAPKQTSLYPLPKTLKELVNVSVMPIDHRNYALTWFSLSTATALLAVKALRRRPTRT